MVTVTYSQLCWCPPLPCGVCTATAGRSSRSPWRPSRCSARTGPLCSVVRATTACQSWRSWRAMSCRMWLPRRRRWPRAFGIGAAARRAGACVGCSYAWIFPQSPSRQAHCGKRRRWRDICPRVCGGIGVRKAS